ncbi:hypothetical protein L6R52_34890, partial [Myxococcota bacterium]|nr:hypothetical protein [Myxococcota bacterium]
TERREVPREPAPAREPSPATEAAQAPLDVIVARARALEARASALIADPERVGAAGEAQKLLFRIALVRASKNPERAAEQLDEIERALAPLEKR